MRMGEKKGKRSIAIGMAASMRTGISAFQTTRARKGRTQKFDLWTADEERAFEEMMGMILIFEPSERTTVEQVVQCNLMQQWVKKCKKSRTYWEQIISRLNNDSSLTSVITVSQSALFILGI